MFELSLHLRGIWPTVRRLLGSQVAAASSWVMNDTLATRDISILMLLLSLVATILVDFKFLKWMPQHFKGQLYNLPPHSKVQNRQRGWNFVLPKQNNFHKLKLRHRECDYWVTYRISSYKVLPWIILAFLIMPTPDTLLCRWNLVISN